MFLQLWWTEWAEDQIEQGTQNLHPMSTVGVKRGFHLLVSISILVSFLLQNKNRSPGNSQVLWSGNSQSLEKLPPAADRYKYKDLQPDITQE